MWYCVDDCVWVWVYVCVGVGVIVCGCGCGCDCVWVCIMCVCVHVHTHCRTYMFEPDSQILEFFGEFRDHKGDEVRYPIAVPWFTLNGYPVPELTYVSLHLSSSGVVQDVTTNQA